MQALGDPTPADPVPVHPGLPGRGDVADSAMGWHWCLDKLDAEVSGRPVPGEWDAFSAEVGPAYGRS